MTERTPARTCPPDHDHGSKNTCYSHHRCRCLPCRVQNAARNATYIAEKKAGTPRLVDAQPSREHIQHLQAFGIGARQIATLAGVNYASIENIIWGHALSTPNRYRPRIPASRVHRRTEAAILSVKADPWALSPLTCIPARGAHRRLQALVARGWNLKYLGQRLGMSAESAGRVLRNESVHAETLWAIAKLFDELWNVEPPRETADERSTATRMVRHAAARRWLPPLAWDDIDNDPTPPVAGPDSAIDEIAVELVISGETGLRLNRAERHQVVKVLHGRRWSDGMIADHVGVDDRTILRDREDLGLEAFDQTELVRRAAA